MLFQQNQLYFLDGAMGTELQRRGISVDLPLWSAQALFDHPDIVNNIHREYILAGADIITTNTFRTQRRTLKKAGRAAETERINALAVDLAVQTRDEVNADRPVLIAASMTTLEDCYRPDLAPSDDILQQEHEEQTQLLASQPIDLLLLETFNSVRETLAACRAASATGKPFAVSMVINRHGDLLSGEPLSAVIDAVDPLQPEAYLINCIVPEIATIGIKRLLDATNRPTGVYANGAGHANALGEWVLEGSQTIDQYMAFCKQWAALGVSIIGSCCGSTPEYTRRYSRLTSPTRRHRRQYSQLRHL